MAGDFDTEVPYPLTRPGLARVAAELNSRPRKTLSGLTPAAVMQKLLSDYPVATTA
jgi:IS30 family transposase